jgi:ubiquinone/menaquinone biosynthesis C-methylase UbiE
MEDITSLYTTRFSYFERVKKKALWRVLCQDFLQQFIKKGETVVDVGAGSCEFINNISCKRKIAVDQSLGILKQAKRNVEKKIGSTKYPLRALKGEKVDVFFVSNFLEHLEGKEDVFRFLRETYLLLKKGGRLLVMQPDIGRVGEAYWDFFDHKTPITLKSLIEVLMAVGYKIAYVRDPFLPYSTKTVRFPLWPTLLKVDLRVRPLQVIFGKQFFLVAEK